MEILVAVELEPALNVTAVHTTEEIAVPDAFSLFAPSLAS